MTVAEHRIDELRDEGLETRNSGFGEEQDRISSVTVLVKLDGSAAVSDCSTFLDEMR